LGKRLVILGAGESGTGCAILGLKHDYQVFVSDAGQIKENYKLELDIAKIAYEEGAHSEEFILNADVVIKSPGIPDKAEIIQKIKALNIQIVSEI
jgi:UDP-N-acetylmuramoylalanine--D-glutamate ligase